MAAFYYVLTKGNYTKFLGWLERERLLCEKCGEEIHPGDEIHRCGKMYARENQWGEPQGNPRCRLYHSECFEELFFEEKGRGKE